MFGNRGHALQSLESYVLQHRAQLVVVDSIAALARTEFGGPPGGAAGAGGAAGGPGGGGGGSIMERQALLGRLASQLKHVAESLQVPVLVTNQVGGATVYGRRGHWCMGSAALWESVEACWAPTRWGYA